MPPSPLLGLLGARVVAFHAAFVQMFDSIPAALMLQQIVFWTQVDGDPDGWTLRTAEDYGAATTLSARQQHRARARLQAAGIIDQKRRGNAGRLAVRVDFPALEKALAEHATTRPKRDPEDTEARSGTGQNVHPEPDKLSTSFLSREKDVEIYISGRAREGTSDTPKRDPCPWESDLYRLGWANGDRLDERQTARVVSDFGMLDLADEAERFVAYWQRKGKPKGNWNTYLRLRTWLRNAKESHGKRSQADQRRSPRSPDALRVRGPIKDSDPDPFDDLAGQLRRRELRRLSGGGDRVR